MKLASALAAVPGKHRAVVAAGIGLPKDATADEIAASLVDPNVLDGVVAALREDALAGAARRVLGGNFRLDGYAFGTLRSHGDLELERAGLAFGFRGQWQVEYLVPDDLVAPLAASLARTQLTAVRSVGVGDVARWFGASLQLAHDTASIWAALRREPVRVKTDGVIYQRATPRLAAALAPTGFDTFEDAWIGRRLEGALRFLREEACVRLLTETASGEARRELIAAGDPLAVLSLAPDALHARLERGCVADELELAGTAVIAARGPEPIALEAFGRAVLGLVWLFRRYPGEQSRAVEFEIAVRALGFPWLAGLLEIGLDQAGQPVAVRAPAGEDRRDELAARREAGPLAVCQSNFEVVLLRRPSPADRLRLELCAEPVQGQPHVYAITRGSITVGQRAGIHPGGALGLLRAIAGELPQNVERTVSDWVAGIGQPLRIRTAMVLDAGDAATAERLVSGPLGRLVVERVGESMLAFDAGRQSEVLRVLKAAGHELEPGIDHISGTWREPRSQSSDADAVWSPRAAGAADDERPVSTVSEGEPPRSRPAASPALDEMTIAFDLDDELDGAGLDDQDLPIEVILDAIDDEADIRIVYAAASGLQTLTITPVEIDGAQLHAFSHGPGEIEQRFWIPGIRSAEYLAA